MRGCERGRAAETGVTGTQEDDDIVDIPTKAPEGIVGNLGDGTLRPAMPLRRGVFCQRIVSPSASKAQAPLRRENRDAGSVAAAVGPHHSIDSRQVTAGTSFSEGGGAGTAPELAGGADRSPESTEPAPDFVTANRKLRRLKQRYVNRCDPVAANRIKNALDAARHRIMPIFHSYIGDGKKINAKSAEATIPEQAYLDLCERACQAERDGDSLTGLALRGRLAVCSETTDKKFQELHKQYGEGVTLSTEAGLRSPGSVAPGAPLEVAKPSAVEIRTFDWVSEYNRVRKLYQQFRTLGPKDLARDFRSACIRIGLTVRHCYVAVLASTEEQSAKQPNRRRTEHRYRAIVDMARKAADSNDNELAAKCKLSLEEVHRESIAALNGLRFKHGRFEDLALQPKRSKPQEPVTIAPPAAGRQPLDPTVQPPAIGADSSGGANGTRSPALPLSDDDFAVERALLAGELPPGFDASLLIGEASVGDEQWLVNALEARQLPTPALEAALQFYQANNKEGTNTPYIEYLRSVKENIEHALRYAYPGRAEPEWLARVEAQLLPRVERLEVRVATIPSPTVPSTTQ